MYKKNYQKQLEKIKYSTKSYVDLHEELMYGTCKVF